MSEQPTKYVTSHKKSDQIKSRPREEERKKNNKYTAEHNAPSYQIISMPTMHALLPPISSSLNSTGGGGGGAVAVGLHLAPVEAPVAVAGGAYERLGRALRPQRHELAASVHGVPADVGRVVALALHVLHHLRLLPLRRHGRILLRTHRQQLWKEN
jgi:hypothetical protein